MKRQAEISFALIIFVVVSCMAAAPAAFGFGGSTARYCNSANEPKTGGFKPVQPSSSLEADSGRLISAQPLKPAVDLSSGMPPVGYQGNQNSCVAWATAYYYKTWYEKEEHPQWDLSNSEYQFSPSFVYNQINGGVNGGAAFPDAFQLMEDTGCVDLLEFPYDGDYLKQPEPDQKEAAEQFKIKQKWGYFFAEYDWAHATPGSYSHDVGDLKAWLNSGKPLVMGIPIYGDFPDTYGNPAAGYYKSADDYSTSDFYGGHAVFIAGYDDNANPGGLTPETRGGFLLVNSWGSEWNGNGTLWISYKFVEKWVREAWLMEDRDSNPVIDSITPPTADSGDLVTIKGENLGSFRRAARVSFPGLVTYPNIRSWVNDEIEVIVPGGVIEGDLHIYDWDGYRSNPIVFRPGSDSGPGDYWFITEGSTWPGFDEWILIQNPNREESEADVLFLTPEGPVNGPAVNVPAMSRVTVHVNDYLPNQDVSAIIEVTNGVSVCCERAMYFQTADGKWGSHDSIASTGVSTEWYLAEGATWPGFDEWILIMNPFSDAVDVKVSFQTAAGDVSGPTINLPAGSRYSLHVNDYLPNQDVSTKVDCLDLTRGVVAERAMYMNTSDGKIGCHNSLGSDRTSNSWGLAEGATWPGYEEWVLVQNPVPGKSVDIELFFLTPEGRVDGPKTEVPGGARISIRVNDYVPDEDVSTMVFTTDDDDKVVVERAMYVRSQDGKTGSHNAPASIYSGDSWYLPEGCTSPGFNEWISVVNPDYEEAVDVALTFMTPNGPVAGPRVTLEPGFRETFNVNSYVSGDVSARIDSSGHVLCERAMYVSAADGKAGAHCSLGVLAEFISVDSAGSGYKPGGRETGSPGLSELRENYLH